jgi:hypothetical protein
VSWQGLALPTIRNMTTTTATPPKPRTSGNPEKKEIMQLT